MSFSGFTLEKSSLSCHSLSMKKGSVVFFLWSLKRVSDLENHCKTSNPPHDLTFEGTDLIPRVLMLAVINRAVPKNNKNSPSSNFYCLGTQEQKILWRVDRNAPWYDWVCPSGTDLQLLPISFTSVKMYWWKELISSVSISLIHPYLQQLVAVSMLWCYLVFFNPKWQNYQKENLGGK